MLLLESWRQCLYRETISDSTARALTKWDLLYSACGCAIRAEAWSKNLVRRCNVCVKKDDVLVLVKNCRAIQNKNVWLRRKQSKNRIDGLVLVNLGVGDRVVTTVYWRSMMERKVSEKKNWEKWNLMGDQTANWVTKIFYGRLTLMATRPCWARAVFVLNQNAQRVRVLVLI